MKVLLVIAFFLLIPVAFAFPVINELMYNPAPAQGNDTALEWIELGSADEVNLSNFLLDGKKLNGSFSGYLIVARNAERFSAHYGGLGCLVLQMSMRLSNDEDVITLSSEGYEDVAAYTPALGGNGNGKTLERNASGRFQESFVVGGTPCQNNSVLALLKTPESVQPVQPFAPLSPLLAPPQDNAATPPDMVLGISIIGIMSNPEGNDDAAMPGGEWVEIYNQNSVAADMEGWVLQDESGHVLRIIANNTALLQLLPSSSVKVYRNQDTRFSLNNDGDTVMLVDGLARILDTASYSGSKEGRVLRKMNNAWVSEEKPVASSGKTTSASGSSNKKTKTTLPLLIGNPSREKIVPKTVTTTTTATLMQPPAGEVVYVSSQTAASKSGLYFFALSMILLVIVLVFKKDF